MFNWIKKITGKSNTPQNTNKKPEKPLINNEKYSDMDKHIAFIEACMEKPVGREVLATVMRKMEDEKREQREKEEFIEKKNLIIEKLNYELKDIFMEEYQTEILETLKEHLIQMEEDDDSFIEDINEDFKKGLITEVDREVFIKKIHNEYDYIESYLTSKKETISNQIFDILLLKLKNKLEDIHSLEELDDFFNNKNNKIIWEKTEDKDEDDITDIYNETIKIEVSEFGILEEEIERFLDKVKNINKKVNSISERIYQKKRAEEKYNNIIDLQCKKLKFPKTLYYSEMNFDSEIKKVNLDDIYGEE